MPEFKHTTEEMTPEHRLRGIAAILARGVLRVRKHLMFGPKETSPNRRDSGSTSLDVGRDSRLTGHTG